MTGKRRRTLGLVGLALVWAMVAAGCGADEEPAAPTAPAGERGGVFRTAVEEFNFTGAFDPTGEYLGAAWGYLQALTRTLMNYKHVAGTAGNELFPDLAADKPQVSPDGLTYTFKLKQGVKFGPPLNREITSKDIEYAFSRINNQALTAQYGFYYTVIKGLDTKATSIGDVEGIETPDDKTIVFHLTQPTGDFLYRLAMPATGPIPQEVAKCFTKPGDYGRFVISSGPYMIAGSDKLDASSCGAMKPISGFDPTKKLNMVRNPNYDQATDNLRSNFVDGISLTINTNTVDIFNRVQEGQLDSNYSSKPPRTVLAQYLTNPDRKKLLHSNSGDRTWYLYFNLLTPPFDDVHVRKAVNFVVDKAAMQQAWGGATVGKLATHIMPPEMLNNQLTESYDPYATPDHHGDEAKAKEEMKQSRYDSNKDGVCDHASCKNLLMVNRNTAPWTDAEPVVVESLKKLGIGVRPRELESSYDTIQIVKNMVPIALNAGWGKDYADPYTFASPLFESTSIIAEGNNNYPLVGITQQQIQEIGIKAPPSGLPPSVDADIANCQKLPGTTPEEADARITCWANFDKKLMEEIVPWVPYIWENVITITNPSVTKFEFDQFAGLPSFTQIAVNNKVSADTLT
jgi:peptide/nickel transport system substrate-binding protein